MQLTAAVPNTDVSATLTLLIRPSALAEVDVTPGSPQTLRAGETLLFQALGRDRYQNRIDLSNPRNGEPQPKIHWKVSGGIGEIDENGVFVATTVGTGRVEVSVGEMQRTSAEITVIPGELAGLRITPAIEQIRIGESQIFTVSGSDTFDNTVDLAGTEVNWEIIGEIGRFVEDEGIVPTERPFEPTTLNTGQIRATVGEIQATTPPMTVLVGRAATIRLSPDTGINLIAGETQQFRAVAQDARGNEVVRFDDPMRWEVFGSPIGAITRDGLLTAKTPGFGQVMVSIGDVFAESGLIAVQAGPLEQLVLSPTSAGLIAGETQQFSVVGQDVVGNRVRIEEIQWDVLGDIGEISDRGLFTAQRAGSGQIQVSAEPSAADGAGRLTQHSGQLTVRPAQLSEIQVTPETDLILGVGENFNFVATGVDAFGNAVPLSDPLWEVVGDIGIINPIGNFTALRENSGRVRVSSDGFTGESGEIVITSPHRLLLSDITAGREQESTMQIAIQSPDTGEVGSSAPSPISAELRLRYPADLLNFLRLEQTSSIQEAKAINQPVEGFVALSFQFQSTAAAEAATDLLHLTFVVTADAPIDATGMIEVESARFLDAEGKNVPVRSGQSRLTVLPDVTLALDTAIVAPGASTTFPLSLRQAFRSSAGQGIQGVIQMRSHPTLTPIVSIAPNPALGGQVAVESHSAGEAELKLDGIPDSAALESGVLIAYVSIRLDASATPNAQMPIALSAKLVTAEGFPYGIVTQPGEIIVLDNRPPGGVIQINDGANYTADRDVVLAIEGIDAGGQVTAMRFVNDQDFAGVGDVGPDWIDFAPSFAWRLSSGEGPKTVFAQLRDAAGNVSNATISDQIILDTTPPIGSLTIAEKPTKNLRVTLHLRADDALSDMEATGQVRLRNRDGNFPDEAEGWQPFQPVMVWALSEGRGRKTIFAQFRDAAQNLSTITSDTTELDDQPPQLLSVRPEDGAIYRPVNTPIVIAFSEILAGANLSTSLLTVIGEQSGSHSGLLKVRGSQLDFVANRLFADLETVTVTLKAGVRDRAGNASPTTLSWRFSTGVGVWPGDTNNDGRVDSLDIVPIGKYWGQTGPPRESSLAGGAPTEWRVQPALPFTTPATTYADADGNGVVNADDVMPISLNWNRSREGGPTQSPSLSTAQGRIDESRNTPHAPQVLHEDTEKWLAIYRTIHAKLLTLPPTLEGVIALRKIIEVQLARLESQLFPGETRLLPNFPNPFNPETWIPYQLAEDGEVAIEIYNLQGRLVRRLNAGHQRRGYYIEKGKAVHWDGRNRWGERVASSVYIYRLNVGDFSETRRLVLIK
ncbi:MAG: Ig-like domain-containing protein [Candidatus Poribacteria bacterium]|nr:Ig-like domain-containing protein [Candidatus Poribacteria bacterium]